MTSQNRIKARGVADYFMTKNNQPIEIVDQSSTIDSKEQLIALFQKMEDAIMSADTSK